MPRLFQKRFLRPNPTYTISGEGHMPQTIMQNYIILYRYNSYFRKYGICAAFIISSAQNKEKCFLLSYSIEPNDGVWNW